MKHTPQIFAKKISSEKKNEWSQMEEMFVGLMLFFVAFSAMLLTIINSSGDSLTGVLSQKQEMSETAEGYKQVRSDLYKEMNNNFTMQWGTWGASINKADLAVQFFNPDCSRVNAQSEDGEKPSEVFFQPGKYQLTDYAKKILREFVPKYVGILTSDEFKDHIIEIRIEGHTSSDWRRNSTSEENYLGNLALSQKRARSVIAYLIELKLEEVDMETDEDPFEVLRGENWSWLQKRITANGLSSSQTITDKLTNKEDQACSRRVVFRVVTDGDAQLQKLLEQGG